MVQNAFWATYRVTHDMGELAFVVQIEIDNLTFDSAYRDADESDRQVIMGKYQAEVMRLYGRRDTGVLWNDLDFKIVKLRPSSLPAKAFDDLPTYGPDTLDS